MTSDFEKEGAMSQDLRHAELREKTQQLLRGALKRARAATLAAVLVPLGVVAVATAECADPTDSCVSVAEPATITLVGLGAGAAGVAAWWKRRSKK